MSYVIGKDFNTKDWWAYNDVTDEYECYFDTEEEAIAWVEEQED